MLNILIMICCFLAGFLICAFLTGGIHLKNKQYFELLESILLDLENYEHKRDLKGIVGALIIRIKIMLNMELGK